MKDIIEHYKELGRKSNDILSDSLHPSRSELTAKSHSAIFDYNSLIEIIRNRPEYEILRIALREYQMSILSLNLGLYNQSFISLRFFFERSLVAILFSSKEMEFRLWQKGERDTYWSEIMDENNGIFSHLFCRAFFPEIKDELLHIRSLSQKVYRECSEYVHGNLSVQDKIPENLEFREFLFSEWHHKANTIKRIIIFTYCLRYLRFISSEDVKKIESVVLEEFGHLPAINAIFNK